MRDRLSFQIERVQAAVAETSNVRNLRLAWAWTVAPRSAEKEVASWLPIPMAGNLWKGRKKCLECQLEVHKQLRVTIESIQG